MNINKDLSIKEIFSKAVRYHSDNKLNLAKNTYEEVINKDPHHIDALNNLGIIFFNLKNFEEATRVYEKIINIDSQNLQSYNNLGLLFKQTGEYKKAINYYEKAIKINPNYINAYNNIGLVFFELGKYQRAINNFDKAIKINPNLFILYCNIGLCYEKIRNPQKAIDSYQKVPKLDINYINAQYNLGSLFYKIKQYEKASKIFSSINYKKSKSYLLKSLYKLNDKSNFFKELDKEILNGTCNALVGSIISLSKIRYDIKKKNLFCEAPLNYVQTINLTENYDFKNIFIKTTNDILYDNDFVNRSQPLLINGTQSAGNIFFNENKLIKKIEDIIHIEIEKFRLNFNKSNEGLIKNWPKKYKLDGWLIKMKNGGKIEPHIHEHGWLSGSIYINVPPKLDLNSGNLVVSLSDKQNNTHKNGVDKITKIVNVVTGTFCLFPASLFHYTIPFKSDEERIVLAFDVIPN
tara:strand:+ start:588 stop:1976 length:1389 start_codon:yes stop_codon:yes gene_type:complete